jgi:hypothetical protein
MRESQVLLRALAAIWAILLFMAVGCAGGGNPVQPSQSNQTPVIQQDRLLNETVVSPQGGTIDLGWFALDFPSGTLKESARVRVYESRLTRPHEGIIVGGTPIHLVIEPVPDPSVVRHALEPVLADGQYYKCTFRLDRMSANQGDFAASNQFVDIVGEWKDLDAVKVGDAWAHRSGNDISHLINQQDITLAAVDFSHAPEIAAKPIFTDDPRDLQNGPYRRFVQAINFNPQNLGPLNGRIPVILIHGLQLFDPNEPNNLNDQTSTPAEDSFSDVLAALNGSYQNLYSEFKFFWYAYPTGIRIFGSGGSGKALEDLIMQWANANDRTMASARVVIISHSMGGVVGRDFMENEGGNVFRIITVGSPHYGTPIVNICDDIGFGWMQYFLSPGAKDLASPEKIKYSNIPFITFTCSLLNPDLLALDGKLGENDPRLIVYGGTSTKSRSPWPWDLENYWGLTALKWVVSPTAYKEGNGGYYSDCVVPWRSAYYNHSAIFDPSDMTRTTMSKYHTELLKDPKIVNQLYLDLLTIHSQY